MVLVTRFHNLLTMSIQLAARLAAAAVAAAVVTVSVLVALAALAEQLAALALAALTLGVDNLLLSIVMWRRPTLAPRMEKG